MKDAEFRGSKTPGTGLHVLSEVLRMGYTALRDQQHTETKQFKAEVSNLILWLQVFIPTTQEQPIFNTLISAFNRLSGVAPLWIR